MPFAGQKVMSVSRVQWPGGGGADVRTRSFRDTPRKAERTAGPPAVLASCRQGRRVARVRASAGLGGRDVGHVGHVDLGDPLLHLCRVNGRHEVECRVVCRENGVVCGRAAVSAWNGRGDWLGTTTIWAQPCPPCWKLRRWSRSQEETTARVRRAPQGTRRHAGPPARSARPVALAPPTRRRLLRVASLSSS